MVSGASLFRAARWVVLGIVILFVAVNVVLRIETYRFQRRAERLMDDFQNLKLRHSTWQDAEVLMKRWGKYGDYRGSCDAGACRYTIALESPPMQLVEWYFRTSLSGMTVQHPWLWRIVVTPVALLESIGNRETAIWTVFVVQDGLMVRKRAT